jgi:hypothetical protein
MKKQKILKNIITPAVGVIGASSIVATTATSCSAETIDFGTIDCE